MLACFKCMSGCINNNISKNICSRRMTTIKDHQQDTYLNSKNGYKLLLQNRSRNSPNIKDCVSKHQHMYTSTRGLVAMHLPNTLLIHIYNSCPRCIADWPPTPSTNNIITIHQTTAGLLINDTHTNNQFANEPEGLRHFQDHCWKALGEENPDLSGPFLFRHYFESYTE